MYDVKSINQVTDRPVKMLMKKSSPPPTSVRSNNISELLRKKIKIDEAKLNGITFQIADTQRDLLEAYKIVHDVYVAEGYMDPHPTGLRVTQYHALPLTTTFVGKINDKVVLTMSLIPDSTLGLPMDSKYRQELDVLRKQNRYLAEVGNLASSPSFRNSDQNVPMHGNKIMHRYAGKYLCVDDLVITINPKHRWFYEHILLFEQIGEERQYEFVKGAPAIAMRLDLKTAQQRYAAVYDGLAVDNDLHSFFFVADSKCIHLPKQKLPVDVEERNEVETINSASVHEAINFKYHFKRNIN